MNILFGVDVNGKQLHTMEKLPNALRITVDDGLQGWLQLSFEWPTIVHCSADFPDLLAAPPGHTARTLHWIEDVLDGLWCVVTKLGASCSIRAKELHVVRVPP